MFKKSPDTCTEFLDNLRAFRAGTLSEDTQIRLETHRLECPKCQKALVEEERVALLMAEIPQTEAPADFRDRVLRAWRLKRDAVRDTLPFASIKRLQIGLGIFIAVVLLLPMARNALFASASNLTGALDRLPDELREGIPVSFNIPTWAEISAYFQVWQGKLFEWMGETGAVIAPWSGWLVGLVVLLLILAAGNLFWLRGKLPVQNAQDAGNMKK